MNPKETLEYIDGYIQEILADDKYDMHLRTVKCFNKIRELIDEVDITNTREVISPPLPPAPEYIKEGKDQPEPDEPDVVISCDASITKNPGGAAAIAIVARRRGMAPTIQSLPMPKANTINEAEYDAIYHAVDHIRKWPGSYGGFNVLIISDSQLAVNQLNGKWECKEPRLARKKKFILELINNLSDIDARHEETKITITWEPRCSTDDLRCANNEAQNVLGVKNH